MKKDIKDINWYANFFSIVAGMIVILTFIDFPNILQLPSLLKSPKIEKAMNVSGSLNMSALDAIDYLALNDYEKIDYSTICYNRKGKSSYLECGFDSFFHEIPCAWNLYIKDNVFSLYGITVNITTIDEANKIVTQNGWFLSNPQKLFNYSSTDTLKYKKYESSRTIVFKTDKGVVKEICILYHSP